jgi:hypothetical protein
MAFYEKKVKRNLTVFKMLQFEVSCDFLQILTRVGMEPVAKHFAKIEDIPIRENSCLTCLRIEVLGSHYGKDRTA